MLECCSEWIPIAGPRSWWTVLSAAGCQGPAFPHCSGQPELPQPVRGLTSDSVQLAQIAMLAASFEMGEQLGSGIRDLNPAGEPAKTQGLYGLMRDSAEITPSVFPLFDVLKKRTNGSGQAAGRQCH